MDRQNRKLGTPELADGSCLVAQRYSSAPVLLRHSELGSPPTGPKPARSGPVDSAHSFAYD